MTRHDFLIQRHNISKKLLNSLGFSITHIDTLIQTDLIFMPIYNRCKYYTLTSIECMYSLYTSVNYISQNHISGDFVECGVWKGGSLMLIALTLLQRNDTTHNIYAYDTFEGMTPPTSHDYQISTHLKDPTKMSWVWSGLTDFQRNIQSTHYPQDKVIIVKGKVEDTLPQTAPPSISLLRLDTDWYESTKHELEHLYPLLTKGGVLIIDDYGDWAGSKKATDDYISTNHIPLLLNRIDFSGRIAIKVS